MTVISLSPLKNAFFLNVWLSDVLLFNSSYFGSRTRLVLYHLDAPNTAHTTFWIFQFLCLYIYKCIIVLFTVNLKSVHLCESLKLLYNFAKGVQSVPVWNDQWHSNIQDCWNRNLIFRRTFNSGENERKKKMYKTFCSYSWVSYVNLIKVLCL